MTTSDLSVLILGATVAFFVTSKLARRANRNNSTMKLINKLLAVMILVLSAFYFYMRFGG